MNKQWADGPLPLIETPRKILAAQGKTESTAAKVATEMAHVHNVMIRGLNSMIIQAPFISKPADIQDFAEFAYAFCVVIHEHHTTEEVLVFPLVEDTTGVEGIMNKNIVQHEMFVPKLHDFQNYVSQIRLGVRKYDAKKFVGLLESFAGLLTEHLADEIPTLLGLEKYDIDWTPVNQRVTKYAVEATDKYHGIPFFLHNMDITYENDMHRDTWPPLPWFAQLIFRWFYVPKHKGAWRFGSCDAYGRPKALEFASTKQNVSS